MPRLIKSRDGITKFPETTEINKLILEKKDLTENPDTNKVELGVGTDGVIRTRDENGVITEVGSGSGGGITADEEIELTNKTIDATKNTIEHLIHGAQVNDPSSGVHGVAGDIVGTTDSQILSNKKYSGGAASDTNKTVLPSGTTGQLDALLTEEGSFYYDTDKKAPVYDNGTQITGISGGGATPFFIEASSNNSESITGNTTNIPFANEVHDTNNEWDGVTFSPSQSGLYQINGGVSGIGGGSLKIGTYVNGAKRRDMGTENSSHIEFNCQEYLVGGVDSLNIRANSSGTLSPNASLHFIQISRVYQG
jgi:hypothetical protein